VVIKNKKIRNLPKKTKACRNKPTGFLTKTSKQNHGREPQNILE